MKPAYAMEQAALAIVEDGLFVFLEPTELTPANDHSYTMRLVPPLPGCAVVGIQADEHAASALAADMLGIEPQELEATDLGDAVAEVLNMVAGRFARDLAPLSGPIDLQPPLAGGQAPPHATCFSVEAGRVALWCAP